MNHTYEIEDIHEIMSLSHDDFASKYGTSTYHARKWLDGLYATLRLARWEPFATVMRELDIDIKPGLFNQDVLNTLQEGSCVSHQAAIFTLAVHEELKGRQS